MGLRFVVYGTDQAVLRRRGVHLRLARETDMLLKSGSCAKELRTLGSSCGAVYKRPYLAPQSHRRPALRVHRCRTLCVALQA